MKSIAIVGAGITGLGAAHYLTKQGFKVEVFEKASRIGGHTHTVPVEQGGQTYWVDTGFIVYNERTYPHFIALMEELGVQGQHTTMGFSVVDESNGQEFAGKGLGSLLPTLRQRLSPKQWKFALDIVRFNQQVKKDLEQDRLDPSLTLAEYLKKLRLGRDFERRYLRPMGAAIWSTPEADMGDFQALFFAKFFYNHGLLDIVNRPQWFSLKGGSKAYLEPLTASFKSSIYTAAHVANIEQTQNGVQMSVDGQPRHFDGLLLATHSDQALKLLTRPTPDQRKVLSGVPYLANEVVLHTDASLMPSLRQCWSAWNYRLDDGAELPLLTYHMNELQRLDAPVDFFVTVNPAGRVDSSKILRSFEYAHPQFKPESPEAQAMLSHLNQNSRLVFGGAWARNGFHEDGLTAGLNAAQALETTLSQAPLAMAGR